jgi:hypothetical protein
MILIASLEGKNISSSSVANLKLTKKYKQVKEKEKTTKHRSKNPLLSKEKLLASHHAIYRRIFKVSPPLKTS